MPGPHQSILKPYHNRIAELRRTDPPTSYAQIAKILEAENGLKVGPSTIFSFVRVRALGGKPKPLKYVLPEPEAPAQKFLAKMLRS
jgi:hypothetical protein